MLSVTAGAIEIPMSVVVTAGGGLTGAIAYVFRLLVFSQNKRTEAQEQRAGELLIQIKAEQAASAEARVQYARSLEQMVQQVTTVLATNTEALRLNTEARNTSQAEVASLVIHKLVELGVIALPHKPTP